MKLAMLHEAGEGTRWTSKITFDPSASNVARFGEGRCKLCGDDVTPTQNYCDQCYESHIGSKRKRQDEFAPHPAAAAANPTARRVQRAIKQSLHELLDFSVKVMGDLETKIDKTPTIKELLELEGKIDAIKAALVAANIGD
jgi:hypothetical protein